MVSTVLLQVQSGLLTVGVKLRKVESYLRTQLGLLYAFRGSKTVNFALSYNFILSLRPTGSLAAEIPNARFLIDLQFLSTLPTILQIIQGLKACSAWGTNNLEALLMGEFPH
jgi:hypothetical protein